MRITNESPSLGRAFGAARRKAGLTLRVLAQKLDVSPAYLCDVEHGRRGIPRIEEAAKLLGTTARKLYGDAKRLSREETRWLNARPDLLQLLRKVRASELLP